MQGLYRDTWYPSPAETDWHRAAVGGMWEEIGRLQFDFLIREGLRPGHTLLDIGCGSLRGGVHFARYLNPGNYVGADIGAELLGAGRAELSAVGVDPDTVTLICDGEFDFARTGRTFDFALAQSLFTHLPLNSIIRCLLRAAPVLNRGGRLYATFNENPDGWHNLDPIRRPNPQSPDVPIVTHFDRDPYHYDVGTFAQIADAAGLALDYIGDWGHPRHQRMLRFTRS
jgi:SAM-dependent methyltransferase